MTQTTRLHVQPLDDRCLPSFSPATGYAAGAVPVAVVTADFNNDGHLDLATADWQEGVGVLLGNADGTFQPATHSPTENQPTSLAVGDFNGDGNLDLAAADASPFSTDLAVMLGTGTGTFGPPTGSDASPFNGVSSVVAGDFTGDGHLDLAFLTDFREGGGSDGTYVGVLPGTGAGTFGVSEGWSPLSASAETHYDSVAADFNGDGHLDLASPSDFGLLQVALGYGDGTFGPATGYYTSSDGSSVAAADFNADGTVDLAAAGYGFVSVLLGTGTGSFGPTQSYTAGSESITGLTAADFDGDGHYDLISSDLMEGTVGVLLNTGAGEFELLVSAVVGVEPFGVAVGDFNGDGSADAVTADRGSGTVSVLLNDGHWPSPPPSLRITDAAVTEGNAGTVAAVFTVTLSPAAAQPVSVAYATGNGTAAAGSDYQAATGTLNFAPGETRKTITVWVTGDRVGEPTEGFVVNLSGPANATIADGQGVGTILDDEPRITIGDVTRAEGRKNQTTLFTFTVTLSAAYDQPVTMSFRTANGTATTSNNDYVARTGTLTFAPGETAKTITIEVKGDNKREANETFSLDLFGNGGNSLLVDGRGVGTIVNDD